MWEAYPLRSLRSPPATPFHWTCPGLSIQHVIVNFPRMIYACFMDLIAIFFDFQRRIRNEASNDQRVWQHPTTTADRVSLRWFADDRNADGRASLRSTPTAATAAAYGGRESVRGCPDSAASGWGIIWKRPAACTINWWFIWKYHDPAAAWSGRVLIREYYDSASSGWWTLWRTAARSATAATATATGRVTFWRHAATISATG